MQKWQTVGCGPTTLQQQFKPPEPLKKSGTWLELDQLNSSGGTLSSQSSSYNTVGHPGFETSIDDCRHHVDNPCRRPLLLSARLTLVAEDNSIPIIYPQSHQRALQAHRTSCDVSGTCCSSTPDEDSLRAYRTIWRVGDTDTPEP